MQRHRCKRPRPRAAPLITCTCRTGVMRLQCIVFTYSYSQFPSLVHALFVVTSDHNRLNANILQLRLNAYTIQVEHSCTVERATCIHAYIQQLFESHTSTIKNDLWSNLLNLWLNTQLELNITSTYIMGKHIHVHHNSPPPLLIGLPVVVQGTRYYWSLITL